MAAGLVVAIAVLRARPDLAGALVALAGVFAGLTVAFWPMAGRTGEEWLPTVAHWLLAGVAGSRIERSPLPLAGLDARMPTPPPTPGRAGAVVARHAPRHARREDLEGEDLRPEGAEGEPEVAEREELRPGDRERDLGRTVERDVVQPARAPQRRAKAGRTRKPGRDKGATAKAKRARSPGRDRSATAGVFAGLTLTDVLPGGGERGRRAGTASVNSVGVLADRRGRTWTATIRAGGHSFTLLDPAEKERRIGAWAGALATLAREGSLVHRLQWMASTIPDDNEAVDRYLFRHAALRPDHPAHRSYRGVMDAAGSTASRHEVLVAIQLRRGRATQRVVRAAGGGEAGARAVLLREVESLQRHLANADMVVEGALSAGELAAVLRRSGRAAPGAAWEPPGVPSTSWEPAGGAPCDHRWPWPMALRSEWGALQTDETWQVTYWIAEWPRVEVGPDFLGPLLLGPERRTVSVVMEPVSPSRAIREVEAARTADVADAELRRRGGFLPTARRAREAELVVRREEELAEGHASYRFSGYVTVTAPTREALEDACAVTEQAAGQSHLELRRLYGDQARAFTYTLPLCRGLS